MTYLAKHKDRYWSFHLKDVVPDKSTDTELGTGTVDFKKLLASVPNLSAKPMLRRAGGPKDELASAKQNAAFLKKLTF